MRVISLLFVIAVGAVISLILFRAQGNGVISTPMPWIVGCAIFFIFFFYWLDSYVDKKYRKLGYSLYACLASFIFAYQAYHLLTLKQCSDAIYQKIPEKAQWMYKTLNYLYSHDLCAVVIVFHGIISSIFLLLIFLNVRSFIKDSTAKPLF